MKKCLILAAAAALLLCSACGEEQSEAVASPTPIAVATPEPTVEPTPEPDSVPGTVLANGVCPVYTYLNRGDEITVTGALEKYYTVSCDGQIMLVNKSFIRLETVKAAEKWSGFAKSGAVVYDTAYLTGEAIATLDLNAVVEVLDQFNGILYISCGDVTGYIAEDLVSDTETPVYAYGGGGGSYSGGGGGSSGGGGGGSGGQDGGDITLGFRSGKTGGVVLLGDISGTVTEEGKSVKPVSATVLTDNFPVYLWEFNRGETVKITQQGDGDWSVLFNGKEGKVASWLLRLQSAGEYTQWLGYAKSGAKLYESYLLYGSATELQLNTVITVLDDLGDRYVVEVNGVLGYMSHDSVSETEISYYSYGGGGSSGGGGGGGSEWTDPVL